MTLSRQARALRGFAVDFLTSHDTAAVEWVMDPAYRLSIGGFVLDGRDQNYLPATAAQLDQFPGLTVTVHDVILGDDGVAMRFTEHGASVRDGGRVAAWRGITLFDLHDGRLMRGWAEEDYFARKRQLKDGIPDPVAPPALAGWDAPVLPPDAGTAAAVHGWTADIFAAAEPVLVGGPGLAEVIEIDSVVVGHLFTAGPRAAAHLECHGRYAGGFADIDPSLTGAPIVLRVAAMLDVVAGSVTRAQVSGDRLGLHRHLLTRQREGA